MWMRRTITGLMLGAVAMLVLAQTQPLMGLGYEVKEPDRDVPVMDIEIGFWSMHDRVGDYDGAYLAHDLPDGRGDLAPWLGPATVATMAAAVVAGVLAMRGKRPVILGVGVAALVLAVVVVGALVDDLNGLAWNLGEEAADAYEATHRSTVGARSFGNGPHYGFPMLVAAQSLIATGVVLAALIRPQVEGTGPLPDLPEHA